MKRSVLLLASCMLALSGCQWFKNRSTKDNLDPPAELVDFETTAPVSRAWSRNLGDGIERSGTKPRPAEDGGVVFASDLDGSVVAIDLLGGKQRWSIDAEKRLSSGPGVGEGLVVVGGLDGDVIALDRDSGSAKWTTNVSSEVLANPIVADGVVVVRSADGRIFGLSAADGSRRWLFDRGVPLISLRGNAAPIVADGNVYAGYDNGKLVALELATGNLLWEQTIATPSGRTELERMSDIDGEIVAADSELYLVTYRGQAAALDRASGRILWTRDMSSFTGVSVGTDEVYLSDADGAVWALDRRSGSSLWKQEALAHRWLSTPVVYGDYLAVGDYGGYLHILSRQDGATAARFHAGDEAIRAAPLVVGAHVVVASVDGELAAFVLEAAN